MRFMEITETDGPQLIQVIFPQEKRNGTEILSLQKQNFFN